MYNNEMKGLNSAAALTTVMARWQDTPLDYGAYYTCSTSAWGCYVTGSNKPTPSYFGLKAFGDIVRYPDRTGAQSDNDRVTVLAGKNAAGAHELLISAFNTGDSHCEVTVDRELSGRKCTVLLLDENHNLSQCVEAEVKGDVITFDFEGNSAVALVKIES